MTYSVFITPTAEQEIREAFAYIHREAPRRAQIWLPLETYPNRCAVAPESEHLGFELRHLLFKSHRIIFWVEERARMVRILGVRHAARQALGEPPMEDEV
jgi:plasmid stabilization system protein ParE